MLRPPFRATCACTRRGNVLGTHTWYRQVRAGRTVVNGWYAVHQWRDGKVTVVDERKGVQGRRAQQPPDRRAHCRCDAVAAASGPAARVTGPARLMVLPSRSGTAAHEAWRVLTTNSQGVTATYVDAANARILRRDRLSREFDGPSPAAPGQRPRPCLRPEPGRGSAARTPHRPQGHQLPRHPRRLPRRRPFRGSTTTTASRGSGYASPTTTARRRTPTNTSTGATTLTSSK